MREHITWLCVWLDFASTIHQRFAGNKWWGLFAYFQVVLLKFGVWRVSVARLACSLPNSSSMFYQHLRLSYCCLQFEFQDMHQRLPFESQTLICQLVWQSISWNGSLPVDQAIIWLIWRSQQRSCASLSCRRKKYGFRFFMIWWLHFAHCC